ncbi:MAG: acetoin utilization protein AcuC [Pseudomonadota bacterium]
MLPLFLGSEIYRASSYGAWHPLRVPRVSTVMDLSRALGWLPTNQFRRSPRAKPSALEAWHTRDYVAALAEAEMTGAVSEAVRERHGLGTVMNPIFAEMYRRPATGAGASLLAGELLRDGGTIHHPGGGTHHGLPDRASGFCYLNDCVLSILSLRRNGVQRVAYVDLDAHHPDGVELAFGQDPDVLMISVHEADRWPRTGRLEDDGAGALFNLPVAAGMGDDEMVLIRDALILPALEQFRPDAIILQMGADTLAGDPQSRQLCSQEAYLGVLRQAKHVAPRLLVLGGGGYNPWTVGRLWTAIWGVLNGHELPGRLSKEAEQVLRDILWDSPRARTAPVYWFTSLVDPPAPGQIRDQTRRDVTRLAERLTDIGR